MWETTFGRATLFVARDHFINLVRNPGCISIVQGGACGGNIGNRDGVGLSSQLGQSTPCHEMPTVRQGLRAMSLSIIGHKTEASGIYQRDAETAEKVVANYQGGITLLYSGLCVLSDPPPPHDRSEVFRPMRGRNRCSAFAPI